MAFPSIFDPSTTTSILNRLEKLSNESQPQWGEMNAAQMLAHLNIAYEMTYDPKTKKSAFQKWLLKLFIKKAVVGERPYPKSSRTAPEFIIKGDRDFETVKQQFIDYVKQTEKNGTAYFEGRDSPSFGPLTSQEWSVLFYKHLDHHFMQFGL